MPFAAAQQPEVAGSGDRGCGNVRNFVLVDESRGGLLGQLARQFLVAETQQIQVEVFGLQGRQVFAEHLLVPARIERELVISDGQGAALNRGQVFQHDDRNFAHALRHGRPQAPFTSNEPALRPNENWVYEAELANGGGDLRHLLGGVRTGVTVARVPPVTRPALDLDIRILPKFAWPTAPSGRKAGGVV